MADPTTPHTVTWWQGEQHCAEDYPTRATAEARAKALRALSDALPRRSFVPIRVRPTAEVRRGHTP